jgi:hypothetical protein
MLQNNGEDMKRDDNPKRVDNRARRLKRKVKKLEGKAEERRVDPVRANEPGLIKERAALITRPTGKAKRAVKKLEKMKKKGKIGDYTLSEKAEKTKDVQSLAKARLRRKRKLPNF